jgi:sugar O-acyltransferase (sialic acid O-acetyltransferase NeuD family)
MKTSGVILLGAAGLAKEFALYIQRTTGVEQLVFVNDLADGQVSLQVGLRSYPVVKDWVFRDKYPFVIAVGKPSLKAQLVSRAIDAGLEPMPTVVDRDAHSLCSSNRLGMGGMIAPGSIVTTNVTLGDYVTLNLNTTVGHDTTIGDYCTTNPGVHISGQCTIGKQNEFGTGACVRDRLSIGSYHTFGAQSAVVKSAHGEDPKVYVGVPAKPMVR